MNTVKLAHSTATGLSGLMQAISNGLTAAVSVPAHVGAHPQAPDGAPRAHQVNAEQLFAEGVRDGWNLESEWLWLASVVEDVARRRYCYERALYINSESATARDELRRL